MGEGRCSFKLNCSEMLSCTTEHPSWVLPGKGLPAAPPNCDFSWESTCTSPLASVYRLSLFPAPTLPVPLSLWSTSDANLGHPFLPPQTFVWLIMIVRSSLAV